MHRIHLQTGLDKFYKSGTIYNAEFDLYIEKNYFKNNILYNGDFSDGLSHWSTNSIKNFGSAISKNTFTISDEECVSPPYSLRICALEYPCRLFYTKQKRNHFLRKAWDFRSSEIFLGVPEKKKIYFSMYYKGVGPTITINHIVDNAQDNFRVLGRKRVDKHALDWERIEFTTITPANNRAIFFEIQVTSLTPQAVMFIDDVCMSIEDI